MITSEQVLTHHDPALPVRLASVLFSHTVMPDGSERPEAFTCRSLTNTERKYAQIEKEALSILWGVKRFHVYLYGRRFTLVTDHKPLTTIFYPKKEVPAMTAARLPCYALFLAGFDYDIEYKKHDQALQCWRTVSASTSADREGRDRNGFVAGVPRNPVWAATGWSSWHGNTSWSNLSKGLRVYRQRMVCPHRWG